MKKKLHKVPPLTKKPSMRDPIKPSHQAAYPEKTSGSEVAAEIRKVANGWSEEKRAQLFERGMRIIYGGSGNKSKLCTRQ